MKRLATWFAVVFIVVAGGIATFYPVDFFRLFDANQKPLVMTELESYCVAFVGMTSNFKDNNPVVGRCMVALDGRKDNTEHNIALATNWMCDGVIAAGFQGGHGLCLRILESNSLWMITTGGLTQEWNDAHPRPTAIAAGQLDSGADRTKSREDEGDTLDYGAPEEGE